MSLPNEQSFVNSRVANTATLDISTPWHELSTLADIAPEGQRPGLARARTRLLDGVPAWRLPAVLDALAAGRALA